MGDKEFQGKVILVTGSSDGIGAEIAFHFAGLGAKVIVNFNSNVEGAVRVIERIKGIGGEAEAIQADVSDKEQVDLLISTILDNHSQIDILINNAGIYPSKAFLETSVEEWDRVIDVNLRSVFLCSQAVGKQMVEKEIKGSMINISSIEARSPAPMHAHYSAAKAGVEMFTKTLALELGRYAIRVNAVAPGLIWKEGLEQAWPEGVARWKKSAPLQRLGKALDIAQTCAFLASEKAEWITGEVITVDGGISVSQTY
jgi:NAD(P)-dependent dehydrogenase (short-subunit alcohol dehydrogenase family)